MKYVLTVLILVSSLLVFSKEKVMISMVEICDNAIDDDGDGLIDLNDNDCECEVKEPESLIPNPSFENQDCCPVSRSSLNCATGWIQASQPTTDYLHSCGFLGWENIPTPLPFPHGEGAVGFRDGRVIMNISQPQWKEYAGACLNAPLLKGVDYTFEFYIGFVSSTTSPPIYITFFGTPDCQNLPFGTQNEFLGCPTNDSKGGWKFLSSKRESGVGWKKMSLTVTPDEDIYAIAIGPPCRENTSSTSLYYFFDNLVLAESKFFRKTIEESENPCTEDFTLSVSPSENATYQWYKDGVAIIGETTTTYQPNLVNGDYSVMEILNGQCNLSHLNSYRVPVDVQTDYQIICFEETYKFGETELAVSGTFQDTFKNADLCDSIVLLELSVLGESRDSVKARIFQGDTYRVENFAFSEPDFYEFSLQSSLGCDSLILLDLSLYKVFIPNVFSPNDDGVNDLFEIFVEEFDVNVAAVSIFNRWGQKVFDHRSSLNEGSIFWDGKVNGETIDPGVYVYLIEFDLNDNENRMISGDVIVAR